MNIQQIKQRTNSLWNQLTQWLDKRTSSFKSFIYSSVGKLIIRISLAVFLTLLTTGITGYALLYAIPDIENHTRQHGNEINLELTKKDSVNLKKQLASNEKRISHLKRQLSVMVPKSPYIVINTTKNEFYLYKNQKLIHQGKCSTGSYTLLLDDKKQWMFKTPKGEFYIQGKTTSPVWIKPDWAFVEEGLPVPPKSDPSRYEYGVLGDYALSLGHGYLIHGTLYQRFLGLPVTHGCVRLGDDDLEIVYQTLNLGSKVFIY